jgi:spore coat protein H
MTARTIAWLARVALATLAGVAPACSTVQPVTPPRAATPVVPAPVVLVPPTPPAPAGATPLVPALPPTAPVVPPAGVSLLPSPQLAASPAPATIDDGTDPAFGLGKVHQFEIALSSAEWSVLQGSSARGGAGLGGTDYTQSDGRIVHTGSGFGGYFPWAHADVRLAGEEFLNVGLRYRGNFSFQSSSAAAPLRANFKLKLDTYGTKGSWEGVKTFNFNAGTIDYSLTREAITFALFRNAGVPAPRTAYAEIHFTVPGAFTRTRGGFYVMIENVNKAFLKHALPPGDGLLMKPEGTTGGIQSLGATWASYPSRLRPDREATPHEQQRVLEFAALISQTDVALFRSRIGTYLDVDEFLRFLAVNAFIENWDSYLGGNHNYYFYLDPRDDKFRFLPWDEDLAMGARGGMGGGNVSLVTPYRGNQPLIYWLLDDPAVQARYRSILKELSEGPLSKAALGKLADTVEAALRSPGAAPRSYLDSRASYLATLVAGWFPAAAPAAKSD